MTAAECGGRNDDVAESGELLQGARGTMKKPAFPLHPVKVLGVGVRDHCSWYALITHARTRWKESEVKQLCFVMALARCWCPPLRFLLHLRAALAKWMDG